MAKKLIEGPLYVKISFMENKNPKDMTIRDMEAFDAGRKISGREKARNMSIKYKIASMTILVALIPMIVLTVLMLFFYNRAIMQRADNQINENIRIMSDRISSVLANGELCSNNLTIEFSGYYNDKSMKQVTRDNKIISQLSQSLLIYNGISSIVFLDKYGRMYATDPALTDLKMDILDSDYVKKLSGEGKLNDDTMLSIMMEQKKPETWNLTLPMDRIRKFFPRSFTPQQMENTILKLLEAWQKKRQRQNEH